MIPIEHYMAPPGQPVNLSEWPPDDTGPFMHKSDTKAIRKENIQHLQELQDKLYALNRYSVLLTFQAMDAGGKDSTIKHVMSGVNPQGCQVFSFKKPSEQELEHDFLWRTYKALPERGRIGIFNRSYYEEVLIARVHPSIVVNQRIPGIHSPEDITEEFWQQRYDSINEMEEHLVRNGTIVLKFFLHLSKEEQKQRFLKRIHRPDKNWKFTMSDIEERKYWDKYQEAFAQAITQTSTEAAPWYIIPADHKWFIRTMVSEIIVQKLESLNLHYPEVTPTQLKNIEKARVMLEDDPES
uniref:Polyphosphate kinase 2 family protein n=1 Tax=Roseihalotalea indica TaxID=2867963 RepID=A0AA49JE74_9BACT|nr:polyphosphate kinase 2 family protein [Tunicatimonas sp. TK19036]